MAYWTAHSLLTTFKYNLLTTCWNHVIKYKMEVSMCPKCLLAISKQTINLYVCMYYIYYICILIRRYTKIESSLKIIRSEDFACKNLFKSIYFISNVQKCRWSYYWMIRFHTNNLLWKLPGLYRLIMTWIKTTTDDTLSFHWGYFQAMTD